MRILKLLLLPAFFLLYTGQPAAAPGIAATVNGVEIPEPKLQAAVNNYMRQRGNDIDATRLPENVKDIRLKVLDILIGQELLWQAALSDKIVADDAAVDAALAQVRAGFDSDADFESKLKEGGFSINSYRADLRRRLSAQQWVHTRVLASLTVDDAAVSRYYESNRERFASPPQVRARHILLRLDADASEADTQNARKRLIDIRERAAAGEEFAALAQEHSQDGSAALGGDLGFFGPGTMVKPFEQAAFALAPGQISDIVQTRFGLHLIQLVERKPGDIYAEAEVAGQIRTFLLRQRHEIELDAAIERLRQQAEIEIANP